MSRVFKKIEFDYSNDYGFPFSSVLGEGANQYSKELFAYTLLRGNYGKQLQANLGIFDLSEYSFEHPAVHLINAIQLGLPQGMADFENYGISNDYLLDIIYEACESDDVGYAGTASSGKTFGVALFLVFDWVAAPHCTTTLVASTTVESLDDRIWRDISKIFRALLYPIGEIIDYKRSIVFGKIGNDDSGNREYSNAIKCVAIEKGSDGKKVVANTKGRKNKRFRVALDEMPEMDMYVSDLRINLAANSDFVFFGIGNPAPGRNPHYELCLPEGYSSFPEEHLGWRRWKTRTGTCVFLSGKRSPNLNAPQGAPVPFPYLGTRATLARQLELCLGNTNSLLYWQNAVGGWPPSGIQTSVLTRDLVISSNSLLEPIWTDKPFVKLLTLDPALTHGGDDAAYTYGWIGEALTETIKDPRGNSHASTVKDVFFKKETSTFSVNASGDYITNLAICTVDKMLSLGVKPENFALDVSGDGGRVAQAIMRELERRKVPNFTSIVLISSMGKPSERPVSNLDRRICSEVYDRIVSEYWFSVALAVQSRCFFGLDPDSQEAEEFYSRQIQKKNGKQSVVTKKEMKAVIGKSPDKSDSICYALELARRKGLSFIVDDNVAEVDFEELRRGRRAPGPEVEFASYSDDSWGED